MILAWVIMSDYELLFAIAPLFVCTFHLVVGANGKPSSWLPTCFAHIEAPSCLHRLYLWPRLDALDPIDTLFANASCLLYFNGWHSSQQHCQDKFLLLLRNIAIVSGHCSKWIGEEWIVYRATSYYPAHCGAAGGAIDTAGTLTSIITLLLPCWCVLGLGSWSRVRVVI